MLYQLISKRKREMFKRVKGSKIIKLIKVAQANQTESIYNLGNEPNPNLGDNQKDYNKSVVSQQVAKSNATEMLCNLSEIDYLNIRFERRLRL